MTKRHSFFDSYGSLGLALVPLILSGRKRTPREPTEAELQAKAVRDERAEWNAKVEARRTSKKVNRK